MGFFGIGDKREKVKKIRLKEKKASLKYMREERGRAAKERDLEGRTRLARTETAYYEAETRKKKAKKGASKLPTFDFSGVKLKKKKQGKKLSSRTRVKLF